MTSTFPPATLFYDFNSKTGMKTPNVRVWKWERAEEKVDAHRHSPGLKKNQKNSETYCEQFMQRT